MVFLTNNALQRLREIMGKLKLTVNKEKTRICFALDALTIAKLYKCRWQVELFFKWIKQHLRIKAFFGTSENSVKSQIWIAVSVYVLIAIVKKRLAPPASLYEILQILSLTLFEKTPVNGLFDDDASQKIPAADANQLNLFN